MTKPVIVTRLGKGSELTFQEGDDNFTNLQNATVTVAGDSGTGQAVELNGTITVAGGTGLSTAMSTGTVTVNLDNTAVTAGTYTNADITVDAQGRVTSASNGAPGYDDADARAALSAGTGISYNSSTGVIASTITQYTDANAKAAITAGTGITVTDGVVATTITQYTDANARSALSASQNLSYNSSTGAFTGPDLSGYQTSLGFTAENSANKNQNNGYAGLDSNGKVASAQLPSYVDDVIESANFAALPAEGETGKIYVTIDTGKVYRWSGSAYVEISASPGSTDSVTEGSTNLYFTTSRARGAFSAGTGISITDGVIANTQSAGIGNLVEDTTPQLGGMLDVNGQQIVSTLNGHIEIVPDGTGKIKLDGLSWPTSDGSNGQVIKTDGAGNLSFGSVSVTLDGIDGVTLSMPSNGQALTYNSGSGEWVNSTITSGITDVVNDTTPQLGGSLDVNGNSIVSASNGNIVLAPNGTGKTKVNAINYNEGAIYTVTYGATITPDVANGNVQTVTLTGNVTFSAFSNPVAGQSLTLKIVQDATGSRTLTSTMKFAGGAKTLTTTANAIDILSVYYDGTNYYASLGKDFK